MKEASVLYSADLFLWIDYFFGIYSAFNLCGPCFKYCVVDFYRAYWSLSAASSKNFLGSTLISWVLDTLEDPILKQVTLVVFTSNVIPGPFSVSDI